jgi:hypothetical protein
LDEICRVFMRLGISSLIPVKKLIASLFQIFPDRMRGKQRVARWLLNALFARKNITQIRGDFGLNYILPNLMENVSFEIFINGIFEKETVDAISSIFSDQNDAVILDIGANIGSISLPLAAQMKNAKNILY